MNEPRVVESVTNECQSLGRAHESSSARAEQLISCLEGEIAKRDAELCERTEEVEHALADLNNALAELAAIKAQEPVAFAFRYDDGSWHDVSSTQHSAGMVSLYAAPVSEAKAQGVVQWPEADEIMQMAFEEGQPADDASGYCFELEEFDLFIERLMSEVARLNAAPVSEAKAQGVVQWPEADEIMQMAFEEGQPADDASGYCFELEEFDLFIERLMSEVARLNAAPVSEAKAQGVVMPDVNAAAKALCNRHAMICGVDAGDQWKEYGQDFIADAETVLANSRLCAATVLEVNAHCAVIPEPYGWVAAGSFYTDRESAICAAEKTPCIDVYSRPQMNALENRSLQRQELAEELARQLNASCAEIRNMRNLYAAPVSEAKAQGVVMPKRIQIAGHLSAVEAYRASGWNQCLDEVARLNASPVQQVSVPDGWRLVPVNATEAILDVLYSNGMDESDSLLQDIWSAMIAAAPVSGGE